MGEAKRRKKLDPDYGKNDKLANLPTEPPKSSAQELDLDPTKKNLDFDDIDEDEDLDEDLIDEDLIDEDLDQDLDEEDHDFNEEHEGKSPLTFFIDYEAKCLTQGGHKVSSSGFIEHSEWINYRYDYADDLSTFSKAYQLALEHFYIFAVEHQGYFGLSQVTITIKNLDFEHGIPDSDW